MAVWEYRDQRIDSLRELVHHKGACHYCHTQMRRYTRGGPHDFEEADVVDWCPACGWWTVVNENQYMDEGYDETLYWKARRGEITESQFDDLLEHYGDKVYVTRIRAAVGSLKELSLADISIPLDEVRDYLAARYSARFQINPRLFEETVAAVFSGLGYAVVVTAYSGDNGIDVIMRRSGDLIGVQVKRYRNAISAEQIRSLTGALVLNGFTKGIFVTTSRFQPGAERTAAVSSVKGIPIELYDADKFYDALRISQCELPRGPFLSDYPFGFQELTLIDEVVVAGS